MPAIRIESKLTHATLRQPLPSSAFKPGGIYRVEFPTGTSLYKITAARAVTNSGAVAVGPSGFVTPWWFSYRTLEAHHPVHGAVKVRGIAEVVDGAQRSRASSPLGSRPIADAVARANGSKTRSLQDFLRARGAVCLDWNKMTHLLIVDLQRPVIGIIGTCSGQPVFDDGGLAQRAGVDNLRFIGGEQQLYLPGLRTGDVIVRRFGALP